jgi:hypothetical protein
MLHLPSVSSCPSPSFVELCPIVDRFNKFNNGTVAVGATVNLVVNLASAYIVAAVDAGFCLHRAAHLWEFPWYYPYLVLEGVALPGMLLIFYMYGDILFSSSCISNECEY